MIKNDNLLRDKQQNSPYMIKDFSLKLYDLNSNNLLNSIEFQEKGNLGLLRSSSDGNYLLICLNGDNKGDNTQIIIFDLKNNEISRKLEGLFQGSLLDVVITSNNQNIISCSLNNDLKIWDFNTGTVLRSLEGHKRFIWRIALSNDESMLVSTDLDKLIKVWDLKTGENIKTLKKYNDPYLVGIRNSKGYLIKMFSGNMMCVAFSPDMHYIISGGDDWTINIWALY